MSKHLYHNTGLLFRFILRRDRIRIPVWLLAISLITIITSSAFTDIYSTDEDRRAIAETMKNPAMTAMIGPGYGLDNYTSGAMMAHQMLLFTAIAVAIMSILLVTRHTRADEEDGRIELIRSLPTGRLSNLSATLLVLFAVNIVLTILVGLGLYALGIDSMDLEGSMVYGAALGATGMFFAAVTAFFAQLSENSRGAIGYSFTVLIAAYLIRAIGDISNETLSWFSPLSWVLGSEVYVNNYWWPILLTVGASIIMAALSLYLNAIRDLESGFLPSRPGRKHASSFLQSPLGLALRLQRTSIIAWVIGMFLMGASYGSILGDLESFYKEIEMIMTPVEGFSLTEQFLTMLMSIMAMIGTVPVLMFILKLRGEEKKNRTEHLLSRAVSRTRLLGSYFVISMVGGFVMLLLSLVGLWFAGKAVMEEAISFESMFNSAMVYLPAIWMIIGVAVLLIGFIPRLTGLTWLYLGYSFFVVYLGGVLQFPDWMGKLSPFGHIPKIPVENMNYMKVSVITILAIITTVIGFIGYNKRDIEG